MVHVVTFPKINCIFALMLEIKHLKLEYISKTKQLKTNGTDQE